MNSDYNKQAEDFLYDTGTSLEVKKSEVQKTPAWASKELEKHGINYTCILSNKNHTYTFDFWGSIQDMELLELAQEAKSRGFSSSYHHAFRDEVYKRGLKIDTGMMFRENKNLINDLIEELKPTSYAVLAALSPLYEDTFEDFCTSMGYDSDSKLAEAVFNNCREQDRNLRKLFTHEQIEKLAEIN